MQFSVCHKAPWWSKHVAQADVGTADAKGRGDVFGLNWVAGDFGLDSLGTFNVVNQARSEKTVFIARPVTFFHVISNSWVELNRISVKKILNPAAELTPGMASSTCPV